jgi:hypothetical protein
MGSQSPQLVATVRSDKNGKSLVISSRWWGRWADTGGASLNGWAARVLVMHYLTVLTYSS